MKLNELKSHARRPVKTSEDKGGVTNGKYVGIHFDDETKQRLRSIIDKEGIPNGLEPDKFHSTVVYSREPVDDFSAMGKFEEPVEAEIDGFDVFTGQEGNKCLVAKLNAPFLNKRHEEARERGASYDYDEYQPHVTLSYKIDDQSIDLDKLTKKYKGHKLNAIEEYETEIEEDWAKKNAKGEM